MAKKSGSADSVYKVIEVIGTSKESWADAGKNAVETAETKKPAALRKFVVSPR